MSGQYSRRATYTLTASTFVVVHTYLAYAAFFSALAIGTYLHYQKIVKNGVAGYPQEWFPSVSATIGDWYPERNIFQILIAMNSGPRFALVLLQYHLQRSSTSRLPGFLCITGIARTLSCGGWVYITSSDDHDWHDILMITYIVCNLPWMYGGIACTSHPKARSRRRLVANSFFLSLVPMIYFFVQHKVHRVPGAYTYYAFFEWSLIILDILYDSILQIDVEHAHLQITVGSSNGDHDIVVPVGKKNASVDVEKSKQVSKEHKSIINPKATEQATLATDNVNSSVLDFLSDLYLSYISWSVFTSLTPVLFYFSVWELGIAGSEFALLSTLSPALLSIPTLLDVASSRTGRTILHCLTLIGLQAFALKSPIYRLVAVAFASSMMCIGWVVDWSATPPSWGYQAMLTGLGFLMASVSKHANHSNNPVWPIVHEVSGGYNKIGITLALLAIANFYTRSTNSARAAYPSNGSFATSKSDTTPLLTRRYWALDGIALGSLIFTLHCFIADSSTLIAWSWTGFPIKGPVPHLHGSLTHVAQALGLLLPTLFSSSSGIFSHPIWFIYGSASAYVTYAYKDWTGYVGGLNFALFLMSIISVVYGRAASSKRLVRTYTTAFLVNALFDVVNTFTVAYAFVPGGEIFRERTDVVLAVQMLAMSFAFQWPSISSPLPASAFRLPSSFKYRSQAMLSILITVSLLATMYCWPAAPQPYRSGSRILRAGIWTVHFGIDNEGRDSQRRMRDLIRDMELDVVGLLETDLHRVVYGNRDLTRVMVEELGFYVDLGPGPNQHTWGAVLLSKFPIINSTHHLLPSPHGELAPAIHAVLDVFGTPVNVIVAHNGQEETPLDRELQATELARIMASVYPQPVIFLGYVVTRPHASRPNPYEIMVTDGKVHDIDKDDGDRWCEYIFYRGLYRTSYARVSRSTITDTELQIGQFMLPKHGYGVTIESEESRYLRAWYYEMSEDHLLPPAYLPERGGVRGHSYHVFNLPLYYKLPEGAVL
ncbi:Frag1/DRAM/Sfk1 family-domain-containing protein [Cytidiella melzeri]|nr:Frag1/DRAM/Sfk1 family-domain-containing protein [Cytidiella melzeri]